MTEKVKNIFPVVFTSFFRHFGLVRRGCFEETGVATFYESISKSLQDWIQEQKVFFVATAASDGRVNLSPKGYDSLAVLGPNRVVWLNLSGSGNETAAHLKSVNRMTLMFCAFSGAPRILRIYGEARTVHPRDVAWNELSNNFKGFPGARQIFDLTVESVQTSCGFAVPRFDFAGERETLLEYAEKFTPEEQAERWKKNNLTSIDGMPTGIFED